MNWPSPSAGSRTTRAASTRPARTTRRRSRRPGSRAIRRLEAHAFCNMSFLARDMGRPREAMRAAQAGERAATPLGLAPAAVAARAARGGRLGRARRPSALRGGPGAGARPLRAGRLGGRSGVDDLLRARPSWRCSRRSADSALGDWSRAARHAHRAAIAAGPALRAEPRAVPGGAGRRTSRGRVRPRVRGGGPSGPGPAEPGPVDPDPGHAGGHRPASWPRTGGAGGGAPSWTRRGDGERY